MRGAGCMSRNLVVDVFCAEVGAGQFPGRAGCADQPDRAIAHLFDEGLEAFAGGRHGVSLGASVIRGHYGMGRGVEQDRLGGC